LGKFGGLSFADGPFFCAFGLWRRLGGRGGIKAAQRQHFATNRKRARFGGNSDEGYRSSFSGAGKDCHADTNRV
jgi:hypothetical protein